MKSTKQAYAELKEQYSDKELQDWLFRLKHLSDHDSATVQKTKPWLYVVSFLFTVLGYVNIAGVVSGIANEGTLMIGQLVLGIIGAWVVGKADSSIRTLRIDKAFRDLVGDDNIPTKYVEVLTERVGDSKRSK